MTRIFFLPNETSLFLYESPAPAEDLVRQVRAGRWLPPPPFQQRIQSASRRTGRPILHAVRAGQAVIVTLTHPLLDPDSPTLPEPLPERMAEVLACLAANMTGNQIAARLHISRRGVYSIISRLKAHFAAPDRRTLLARAAALGYCPPAEPPQKSPRSSHAPGAPSSEY